MQLNYSAENFHPEKHYETVCQWWETQNWPKIPLDLLSSNGIIVTYEGKPVLAGWLYQSDSKIGWIEWIVASPEIRGDERTKAFGILLSTLKERAKSYGYKLIFTSTTHSSLVRRLENNGYTVTDKNVTHLIMNEEEIWR